MIGILIRYFDSGEVAHRSKAEIEIIAPTMIISLSVDVKTTTDELFADSNIDTEIQLPNRYYCSFYHHLLSSCSCSCSWRSCSGWRELMQDRYAGDVGDYSKFSLLRYLFSDARYHLGLIWYQYPDEDHNTDGRYISYVNDSKYTACDPELVDKLKAVTVGERSVAHLEKLAILPANTVYFSKPLDFHLQYPSQSRADKHSRCEARLNWLSNARVTVADCNVICLDPDNGLEIKSVPNFNQVKSGKYAYYSEVAQLYQGKEACVIYQHLNRTASHADQIKQRLNRLKELIPEEDSVFALRFSPYSPRAYFIIARVDVAPAIKQKLEYYLASPCGGFWDSYQSL